MDSPPPPLPAPRSPDPSPSTLPWPDLLAGAASATRRLVAAHSRHFLALSSLLLLPLALLLLSLPSPLLLAASSSPHAAPSVSLRSLLDPRPIPLPAPLPLLALAAALLYLAAFAAAAASAHAGFFGRPVRLLASLLSVPASLLRLLLTALPASPLLLLPLLPLPAQLGTGLAVLGVLLLAPFWSLAGAAAVVESTAGLSPLRRSCRLLSGAPLAALSAFLVFAAGIGVTLWGFGGVAAETYDAAAGWAGMAPVVVKAVVGTALLAVMMLYGMVANVMLYMHCRALHGDLAGEIYNEFADMYVFLPFDEGKDRHVISVVTIWP
ncbi:uncharacterized protein LOC133905445 [Phragmites australis]|uniref:uncharacterized protein LOC133905445 n=1 Tax=Phragmites australis TaxID=29695 RepID=UPI002D76FA12|nr:uncharacterized protein LOC133905445 [Phragmites australis]XP_062203206.1 uncharacterized protein LOC133905445 [Phragmites australis]XP_062203207.1 uncharacterized protein LOC133905445 [Phragmites australis]